MPEGATHGVNYKTQDFSVEVQKITAGKGVDVIIDFVGKTHWHKNIASLAKDGRMTLLATLSGPRRSQYLKRVLAAHNLFVARKRHRRCQPWSHPL